MASISQYGKPTLAPVRSPGASAGAGQASPGAIPPDPALYTSEDEFSSQIRMIENLQKHLENMSPEAMTAHVMPYLPKGSPEENQRLEKQVLEHYQMKTKLSRFQEMRRQFTTPSEQLTDLPKKPQAPGETLIAVPEEHVKEFKALAKDLENYDPKKFLTTLPPKTQEAFQQAELDLAGSLIAQLDRLGEPYTLGNKVKPSTAQLDEALGETKTAKQSLKSTLSSKIMVKIRTKLKAMFRTVCKWLAKQLNKV